MERNKMRKSLIEWRRDRMRIGVKERGGENDDGVGAVSLWDERDREGERLDL